MDKRKGTNNDLQNTAQKTKDRTKTFHTATFYWFVYLCHQDAILKENNMESCSVICEFHFILFYFDLQQNLNLLMKLKVFEK
jgi:hypothetical protein